MNYNEAKETAQRLTNDEYGLAQILDLMTSFPKEKFEEQMRSYVAEFGADEESMTLLLEEMTQAAQKIRAEYRAREDENNAGMTP